MRRQAKAIEKPADVPMASSDDILTLRQVARLMREQKQIGIRLRHERKESNDRIKGLMAREVEIRIALYKHNGRLLDLEGAKSE